MARWRTVLYCTVQCTALYCTVLYCTVLYCTADGSRVTEFSLACDDAGEFVETWPDTCEAYEGCVAR